MTDDEKREFIRSYGVESSKEMTSSQLYDACGILSHLLNEKAQEADIWRKRVIAAICQYIDESNIDVTDKISYAKGIAAKAAGLKSFNEIPTHKLQLLYNMFIKRNALHGDVIQILAEAELCMQQIKKNLGIK